MTEPRGSKGSVRHAAVLAIVLGIVWIVFVAGSLAEFVSRAWANHVPNHIGGRNVVLNGQLLGRVELFNLIGNRGLQVYFHPVNNDLNIINQFALNWWQGVNRPEDGVQDHMDTLNESTPLPGIPPGDDNDPSYYTNSERTHHNNGGFNPNIIFQGGNWWMIDFPGNHNNIRFETWLVTSGGGTVTKLVCFNWGFADGNGVIRNYNHPRFINSNQSIFNLQNMLRVSGFGDYVDLTDQQEGTVPVFVTRFNAVVSDSRVEVKWDIYADEGFAGFNLYRRATGEDWIRINPTLIPTTARGYTDDTVQPERTYEYALTVVDESNTEIDTSPTVSVRTLRYVLALRQNDPNPFSVSTSIGFTVDKAGPVVLQVYDVAGRLVRTIVDRGMTAGNYTETWNGQSATGAQMASGIYFFRLQAGGKTLTRKAVVVR